MSNEDRENIEIKFEYVPSAEMMRELNDSAENAKRALMRLTNAIKVITMAREQSLAGKK